MKVVKIGTRYEEGASTLIKCISTTARQVEDAPGSFYKPPEASVSNTKWPRLLLFASFTPSHNSARSTRNISAKFRYHSTPKALRHTMAGTPTEAGLHFSPLKIIGQVDLYFDPPPHVDGITNRPDIDIFKLKPVI